MALPYPLRSWLSAICAACLLPLSLPAQTGGRTGVVRGQVSNSATGDNLAGVTVIVDDTARSVITTRDGMYEITGLTPGEHRLTFEYPGLDPATEVVNVQSGAPTRRDVALSSEIYVLPEFAVATEREGNAAAIVAQKNAVNVQNVLTSDAFGNIAKGNVGNFLKRIPGIAGTSDEVDTENIVLRGMAANFTSIDIDGTRSAGASPDGRNQSAAAILTDMIERVEVVKAPTPDLDADSLGGRINLVTKSAFDRARRQITLRAASSYSFTYGRDVGRRDGDSFAPSVSGSFSDTFSILGGERNLGVYVNANYERILDVRGTTAWNWGDRTNSGTITGDEIDYPQFNNASVALHEQVRGGANLRFDFRATDALTLQASGGFSTFENNMYRQRNQYQAGTVAEPLSTDPYFVVIDNARYRAVRETRDQTTDKRFTKFNAKYNGENGLKINFDVSYEDANREEYRTSYNPRSRRRLSYVLDRRPGVVDPRWPTIRIIREPTSTSSITTTTMPTTFLDVNPFGDDFSNVDQSTTVWRRHFTDNEVFGSKLDFTKRFEGRLPIEIKTGLRIRKELTKANRDEINGSLVGTDLSAFNDETWDLGGAVGRYPVGTIPSVEKVGEAANFQYVGAPDPLNAWTYNSAVFDINEDNTRGNSLLQDRKIWEDLSAAYIQGTFDLGRLEVLTGVRVEKTDVERSVPVRNRAAAVDGTLAEFTGRERGSASYTNVFPSAHFRYEFSRNLILHASYSTTIGRPNLGNLISNIDVNEDSERISIPNLDLKPQESQNYDVSLEYYFEPIGVVSVGLFRKDIDNYHSSIVTPISEIEAASLGAPIANPLQNEDPALYHWERSTRVNNGYGTVEGVELNYSQSLTFLPGALQGMGIFANFTYIDTEGTFDTGGSTKTSYLENFVPRTANAGLTYAYGRWDLRLQWNYTDAFIEDFNVGDPDHRNKIRGQRWQMDFSGKYKVTRGLTVFADLINLTSGHGKKFRGYIDPVRREETNALGFLLTAGLQANF